MMNIQETSGEPSCKRQENGDVSSGSERPLKKARFAWQVKGNRKYHLKNDDAEAKTPSTSTPEPEKPESSQNDSHTHNIVGSTEQNLEILGDYLLKQDFNTLDSVITDSDKLKPSTSFDSEQLPYPTYVGSYDDQSTDEFMKTLPATMLDPLKYNYEDQCIARWQARQMAKGFVDNTINRVLDSWMVAPLPADIDNRFLALDVAEFINNLPGDNSIENEGILMAISAHGLQNASNSSSSNENTKEDSPKTKVEAFQSHSNSPIQSEDETDQLNTDQIPYNDIEMGWTYDNKNTNARTGSPLYADVSNAYFSYIDNDQLRNSNTEFDGVNGSNECTSHFDFMDAAVSFAIQNKGLTSFGSDYG